MAKTYQSSKLQKIMNKDQKIQDDRTMLQAGSFTLQSDQLTSLTKKSKRLPSYMQPLQKLSEPAKVNPELYKTNYIYVHHEELINNDPMTGVRGINIEKQQLLNQEKLYSLSPRHGTQVKTSSLTKKGDVSSPDIQDV
jgi:hypothetical protein